MKLFAIVLLASCLVMAHSGLFSGKKSDNGRDLSHYVGIRMKTMRDYNGAGAAVLNDRWIVTMAADVLKLNKNSLEVMSAKIIGKNEKVFDIEEIHIKDHIALVKVKGSLSTAGVHFVQLPSSNLLPSKGTVGFITSHHNLKKNDFITKEVYAKVDDNALCASDTRSTPFDASNEFCVSDEPRGQYYKCQAIAGVPFVVPSPSNPEELQVYGVSKDACSRLGQPAAFFSVAKHIDWIKKMISN